MKINNTQLEQIIRESIENELQNQIDEGFFGNVFGGIKNAAQSTGQAIAQRSNKLMADYNTGAAQNAKKDIQAQIQKSQEIIAQEQQKINNLRAKYNQYVQKSDSYIKKANQNAINRGSNTQYNNSGLKQDQQSQDFYNQGEMNKANFSARMKGAQQAHRKSRGNGRKVALEESRLNQIIRESIKRNLK